MSNKDRFMAYANKRLKEKEYKRRREVCELNELQLNGIRRCSNGKWIPGQR